MAVKYCIATNASSESTIEKEIAGVFQWRYVLNGKVFTSVSAIAGIRDGDYDLIHIPFSARNLDLIRTLDDKLGAGAYTKLMISIDIPVCDWKRQKITASDIRRGMRRADFLFATEFSLSRKVEKLTGRRVYELPHPVDLKRLRTGYSIRESRIPTILCNKYHFLLKLFCVFTGLLKFRLRFLINDNQRDYSYSWKHQGLEVVICTNDDDLSEYLAESSLIIAPFDKRNFGKEIILAAGLKRAVIGNNRSDASRRCYPFSICTPLNLPGYFTKYLWLNHDTAMRNFQEENAYAKVEYYNHVNLEKRILDFLHYETGNPVFSYNRHSIRKRPGCLGFFNEINHVSGGKNVEYNLHELVVICLIKDGMEYLSAFLSHYRSMGIVHFFFIDNGSADETRDFLQRCADVTLYETRLAHKKYESEIRRVIIEEHCCGRWCLCVDIDELFDYPNSDHIPVSAFLDYLSTNGFTAVVGYMLDMCAGEIIFEEKKRIPDLETEYCYYDISQIKKGGYFTFSKAFNNYNRLSLKNMPYYYGGIRGQQFKNNSTKYLLIKHPLMFIDNKLEPVTDPHFCNKARIADISCVLRHYKFTTSFKNRVISHLKQQNYALFADKEHRAYYEKIREVNRLDLNTGHLRKFKDVNELVKNRFLHLSQNYLNYTRNRSNLNEHGNE